MSQAIYYIDKDSIDKNGINQDSETFDSIPEQAINIPLGTVLDKETLLTSLAKACNFPSYFGHNWDALWDCLTDNEVKYLKLNLIAVEKIDTEDFNIFKSIIKDAYRDFGRPQLWVIG